MSRRSNFQEMTKKFGGPAPKKPMSTNNTPETPTAGQDGGKYEGHTPGPWTYRDKRGDAFVRSRLICWGKGNMVIAIVTSLESAELRPSKESDANAHLIEDAPLILADRDRLASQLAQAQEDVERLKTERTTLVGITGCHPAYLEQTIRDMQEREDERKPIDAELTKLREELNTAREAHGIYQNLVQSALAEAGAPTHHPDTGAPARKPMTPQERIGWLREENERLKREQLKVGWPHAYMQIQNLERERDQVCNERDVAQSNFETHHAMLVEIATALGVTEMEDGFFTENVLAKIDQLREQNRLALDVCKRIVRQWDEEETVWVGCVEDAQAAIDKAEGGTQ